MEGESVKFDLKQRTGSGNEEENRSSTFKALNLTSAGSCPYVQPMATINNTFWSDTAQKVKGLSVIPFRISLQSKKEGE
jgi:hypothetical protein